jgi:hypothetical protein
MVEFTSAVVMSGFLGADLMKEQLNDESIQKQILKLSDMSIIRS